MKIRRINIKNQQEEVYENIPLVDEVRNDKKSDINFDKGFIKDGKFYCIFRKYNLTHDDRNPIKSVDFYINIIDLNSKKSVYLGKVINSFDMGFKK